VKLLRNLVLGTLALIVAAIVGGFFLPDSARVERSIEIDAAPATVFEVLNSFERFNDWSPWAELDPKTQYSRRGPAQGVGASQAWLSENPSVGSGEQEIIESVANERVKLRVEFTGFDSDNTATYLLLPAGAGTRVIWVYESRFGGNLLARYFGLMLDGMLGPEYEKGLRKLEALLEQP